MSQMHQRDSKIRKTTTDIVRLLDTRRIERERERKRERDRADERTEREKEREKREGKGLTFSLCTHSPPPLSARTTEAVLDCRRGIAVCDGRKRPHWKVHG